MRQDTSVDGFRLAYDRAGHGPAVLLLHGWPGDRAGYSEVIPLVAAAAEVITPDLRGFGDSDQHPADPGAQYSAAAQARSVAGLIEELGLVRPVIAGYDVGSRVAQTLAADRPDLVRALVISPPLPGIGDRILSPGAQREFWYQQFHRLGIAAQLIDGQPDAVREYLRHFWEHWSGPDFRLPARGSNIWSPPTPRRARSRRRSTGTGAARDRSPRALAERPPGQGTGSRSRLPCCGRRTIRCSRWPGRTGSASSTPTRG